MVEIFYNYKEGKDVLHIEKEVKLKDLLGMIKVNPQEVIVKNQDNDEIITEEDFVSPESKIKIFRVVSGG